MKEQIYSVNGTNIYTFVNPNLKSFCLAVYIRAGSLFEDIDNNGITHLLEHTVFRNLKRKYANFYELLALHGIIFSGSTYKEFLSFTVEGPAEEFDFATEILCSVFDEIKISSVEFNLEKARIKAEIREGDERNSLDYFFQKAVWSGTSNEKIILGYCRVLDKISLKKLNDYRNSIFSEGNFFFYATGNVKEESIELFREKVLELNINKSNIGNSNSVQIPDSFFNRDGTVKVKKGYWNYAKIGFDVDSQKYSGGVHDLIYAILFIGDKSLLNNYLSEDNPLVYSFDSMYEQYDNISNINVKFEIEVEKIEKALEIILKALKDLKNGKFNFEANLQSELSSWKVQLDNPSELNWSLAYYNHLLKTDPIDYSQEYFGRYSGVTKKQIMQAASEIFQKNNLTVAIKGNKRKIKTERIKEIFNQL